MRAALAVTFAAVVTIAVAAAVMLNTIEVVDGDTVRIGAQRYRLEGCDAPETYFARCQKELEAGVAATARLQKLIDTLGVRMELTGRDCRWGRPCVNLYVGGENACDVLIREGHAVPYKRRQKRQDWCK